MRLKVSTSSSILGELLPGNKGSLDHVEVGLEQRQPQRALKTCVWLQITDPPLRKRTHIWTSPYAYSCQHVFLDLEDAI